ncbi:hypothetical protein [Sphingobium algorifonticola]|uniref:Uncharacterized protein n=1 Tax=Sphingobium algorifonticola TaxID=2008318 RepID=A0A437JCS9_9SPHN|nr:hypothetical protein [Sphingobium algorifonticola]RVT43674.1 hypothetical protein ENE74_03445 [Sphingobium algorifonticola]
MAKHKPQTRFTIDVGGSPEKVWSVLEKKNGDLIVRPRNSVNHEGFDGDDRILTDRISVHTSDRSGGTTIKRTFEVASGDRLACAAYIRNSKENLLWPTRFVRWQDFRILPKPVAKSGKDSFVDMGWFNPAVQALVTSLVIGGRNNELPKIPGFDLHQASFSRFKVGIYCTFVCTPAYSSGDSFETGTSDQRLNDDPVGTQLPDGAASLTAEQLNEVLAHGVGRLSDAMVRRFVTSGVEHDADVLAKVKAMSSFYLPEACVSVEAMVERMHKGVYKAPDRVHSINLLLRSRRL